MCESHDNLEAIDSAVRFFNDRKVSLVLHAGDFISPFMVECLSKLDMPFKGVLGNNDGDRMRLNEKLSEINSNLTDFLEIEYDNIKVAVIHGDDSSILDALIKCGKYDVVVCGHTHQPEVSEEEGVLVVNPGEVCGYLTGKKTVALLDVEEIKAEIHEI